jgi:MerR family transcriptional regulator, heat shock protein HspR
MLLQDRHPGMTAIVSGSGRLQVRSSGPDQERGVYGISVAAELVGMGVQTLRLYEARGLLEPARTDGGTRRYSADDLARLRRIADLLDAGLNLAGVGMVLDLEAENTQLRAEQEAPAVTRAGASEGPSEVPGGAGPASGS